MKVLSFGEVLWDVYPNEKCLGGAPLNFAAHFKKCGGEAWIITGVGNEALGTETVSEIKKLGIQTEFVTYSDKQTGKCLVSLDDNQVPTYDLLDDVAYDYINNSDFDGMSFDVLYFGTLALRHENNINLLTQIISKNNFKHIFADMNIRSPYYCEATIRFAFENATILKISDEELPIVMGFAKSGNLSLEQSVKLIGEIFKNIKLLIITRGDKGSYVYDYINEKSYECKAQKIKPVSTVGAGDSFSGAFLSRYLTAGDIAKALEFATKISGFVVAHKEAIPDYDIKYFE